MAEENAEGQEGQEGEGEALQLSPSKPEPQESNKMLLIIIGAVVLLIIIISVVLFILFTSDDDDFRIKGGPEEAEFVEEYNRRMQYTLEPIEKPLYTEPFIYTVNMKNGRNYIHVKIQAITQDPAAISFLEARTPLIDDRLINLLRAKFPQDIKTRTGLELLKQEMFIEFNKLFPQEFIDQSASKDRMPVKDILITEFFIQ
ncbi:MAG: flagellar basal body-associated FliL family protein [Proteobacteria bacterium]|nr:flagellar basal body-associated FliL family protein [Pseudomonadota bacterium]